VDFESYEEASKAMREKDHKVFNEKFGDRYVRLIQVGPLWCCLWLPWILHVGGPPVCTTPAAVARASTHASLSMGVSSSVLDTQYVWCCF